MKVAGTRDAGAMGIGVRVARTKETGAEIAMTEKMKAAIIISA